MILEMEIYLNLFESSNVLSNDKQKEIINLKFNGTEIKGLNSVALLGVEIENELNFNSRI